MRWRRSIRAGSMYSDVSLEEFAERLKAAGHTLKRALTDQHIFAGIGNAYSDEILLRAQLSPFKQGSTLNDDEIATSVRCVP